MRNASLPFGAIPYAKASVTIDVTRNHTPEGTKRATSVNVQLPCLQKDLRTGSISRDTEFPLRPLQAQKRYIYGSRTFGAAWHTATHDVDIHGADGDDEDSDDQPNIIVIIIIIISSLIIIIIDSIIIITIIIIMRRRPSVPTVATVVKQSSPGLSDEALISLVFDSGTAVFSFSGEYSSL